MKRPSARTLGVGHFRQIGSIADLYRHYGIDANAIVAAAVTPGRPIRHLKALPPGDPLPTNGRENRRSMRVSR